MTTNPIYRVTLRPLSKYFFGGERYYDEKDSVFYFERSRDYPQQTTVLGALRYQLLLEAQLLEYKTGNRIGIAANQAAAAEALIGKESFKRQVANFGHIRGLSPVFITDEAGNAWFDYPKARQGDDQAPAELEVSYTSDAEMCLGGETIKKLIPHFSAFDHKKGLEMGLLDINRRVFEPRDKVFSASIKEEEQIGVYKPYRTHPDKVVQQMENEGFYKYQYGALNAGYAFGLYVTASQPLSLGNSIVRMGKERTPFALTISEESKLPFQNAPIKPGERLLLLSDAFLPGNWSDCCKAAITEHQPFRNLQYQAAQTEMNYDTTPKKAKNMLNLLKRGSLLYVEDDAQSVQTLNHLFNGQADFLAIGYNHYLAI